MNESCVLSENGISLYFGFGNESSFLSRDNGSVFRIQIDSPDLGKILTQVFAFGLWHAVDNALFGSPFVESLLEGIWAFPIDVIILKSEFWEIVFGQR